MKTGRGIAAKGVRLPWPQAGAGESPLEWAGAAFRGELSSALEACGPFEWVVFSYLAFSSVLITMFAKNLSHPVRLVVQQAFVAFVIFALCGYQARVAKENSNGIATFRQKFWHFWRHWYPHLFFLFCFEELAQLVHLVNPGWEDAKLIAFDHRLMGVHPALWLEQFATPARNDFFQFTYLTYFADLLLVGGLLYYRREWEAYWATMTYSATGYVIGYFIAMMFPIESPWFAMAGMWHGELHGGPFTAVINFIEHFGRVRGAAFPSEHVAGSVAALWGAWRYRRLLFWILLPLVICMCVSTVWGRYHYLADVFAGIGTGTVGYLVGGWLVKSKAAEGRVKWRVLGREAAGFGD
jgi:membrane-associated phospholipid phosphatase